MRKTPVITLLIIIPLLIWSCGKKGAPTDGNEVTYIFTIVAGNGQIDAAADTLSDSLMVRLTDDFGSPVIGDTVYFTQITPDDGGSLIYPQRPTNENGYARTYYVLDTLVGVDTIKAVSSLLGDSAAVYFQITVLPGPAGNLELISPIGLLSGIAGEQLSDSFRVRVTDLYGNPRENDTVYYKSKTRGLALTDLSALHPFESDSAITTSNESGYASAGWVLTINPDPDFGYPNYRPKLVAFIKAVDRFGNPRKDSVSFYAVATDPGLLTYYNDIRPIFERNCFTCHPGLSDYRMDFYYELGNYGNMIPGDTTCQLVVNANPFNHTSNINLVEEDKVVRWVVYDSAAPGSSGLNSYEGGIKNLFSGCISCHGEISPEANYTLTTFDGIRGNGSDGTPNAIAGDSTSLLVEKMIARHNWQALDADSLTAAVRADSIINWIVNDSLRQY